MTTQEISRTRRSMPTSQDSERAFDLTGPERQERGSTLRSRVSAR